MTTRAVAVLAFVGCIWGGSFLFIRVAIEEVTPLQLVVLRAVLGGVALLLYATWRRRPLELSPSKLAVGLFLACVGALIPFFLIGWAETEIESGPTAVLNGTMPLFTLLFASAVLPEERMTRDKTIGVVVGFAGVVILVFDGLDTLTDGSVVAKLAVVAASALYGISAVVMRKAVRRWDTTSMSTLQVTLLAVISLPIVAIDPPSLSLSTDVWLCVLALGFLGTGVAYVAYYWLIENVGSVRASFVAYIIPVVGVIAGVIVLGEDVHWNTFAGGAVILLGVAIGNGLVGQVRREETTASRIR